MVLDNKATAGRQQEAVTSDLCRCCEMINSTVSMNDNKKTCVLKCGSMLWGHVRRGKKKERRRSQRTKDHQQEHEVKGGERAREQLE